MSDAYLRTTVKDIEVRGSKVVQILACGHEVLFECRFGEQNELAELWRKERKGKSATCDLAHEKEGK
jgi:hypothetical protein